LCSGEADMAFINERRFLGRARPDHEHRELISSSMPPTRT
jgi:hypothetical protein